MPENEVTEISEAEAIQLPLFISSPEELLQGPDKESVVAETIHGNTLFSEGVIGGDGEVRNEIVEYFRAQKERGVTHFYIIGLWRPSVFSELAIPYWASQYWGGDVNPSQIGPSCFSVQDYVPNDLIGSWKNLAKVKSIAEEFGVKLIGDFVTNTIAPDSRASIDNPELIAGKRIDEVPVDLQNISDGENGWNQVYPNENLSNGWPSSEKVTEWDNQIQGHKLRVYRNGDREVFVYDRVDYDEAVDLSLKYRIYLTQHIGSCCRTEKNSVSVIERDGEKLVYEHEVGRMGDDSEDFWADTSWLRWGEGAEVNPGVIDWSVDQIRGMQGFVDVVRFDMAHLKPWGYWRLLQDKLGDSFDIETWAEAYSDVCDVEYLKSFINRLYEGWIAKDLRRERVTELMELLRNGDVEKFSKEAIMFIANHDEEIGLDRLRAGAALAVTASMPGAVLLAQGQLDGLERRFSADTRVPWLEYQRMIDGSVESDTAYFEYMQSLSRLMSCAVFRSPRSTAKEPEIVIENGSVLDIESHVEDYNKVFRVARELGDDRVVSVVNYRGHNSGEKITVRNISRLFNLSAEESIDDYVFVNLLSGQTVSAAEELELLPIESSGGGYPGYDVYMYALVRKDRIGIRFELAVVEP